MKPSIYHPQIPLFCSLLFSSKDEPGNEMKLYTVSCWFLSNAVGIRIHLAANVPTPIQYPLSSGHAGATTQRVRKAAPSTGDSTPTYGVSRSILQSIFLLDDNFARKNRSILLKIMSSMKCLISWCSFNVSPLNFGYAEDENRLEFTNRQGLDY